LRRLFAKGSFTVVHDQFFTDDRRILAQYMMAAR